MGGRFGPVPLPCEPRLFRFLRLALAGPGERGRGEIRPPPCRLRLALLGRPRRACLDQRLLGLGERAFRVCRLSAASWAPSSSSSSRAWAVASVACFAARLRSSSPGAPCSRERLSCIARRSRAAFFSWS